MEEQIKRAVRNLNISYIFFWVLPAFLLGAGEFELLPVGSLADNAQAVYYFETLGILLTALCIPLSLKKSLLDPRFDKVEAWRYGPVIPCVYHSFKQFRANPITEKTEVMEWNENDYTPTFHAPELKDEDAKKIVEMVWKRYAEMSDPKIVALTHQKGTPWDICYIEGRNNPIPDELTDAYYRKLVNMISKNAGC